jgi:hypothetical protein
VGSQHETPLHKKHQFIAIHTNDHEPVNGHEVKIIALAYAQLTWHPYECTC